MAIPLSCAYIGSYRCAYGYISANTFSVRLSKCVTYVQPPTHSAANRSSDNQLTNMVSLANTDDKLTNI